MGKKITFDLVLAEILDKISEVKGEKKGTKVVKEIRTVKFIDKDTGMTMNLKDVKAYHQLKDWDASMFEEFAPITITIEMPNQRQTKITDSL